jgi:hypothetical protein
MKKQQNWFHIEEYGTTIDLNKVAAIEWNRISGSARNIRVFTVLHLGTSVTFSPERLAAETNEWILNLDSDRQRLYDELFPGGDIPITLRLNGED